MIVVNFIGMLQIATGWWFDAHRAEILLPLVLYYI